MESKEVDEYRERLSVTALQSPPTIDSISPERVEKVFNKGFMIIWDNQKSQVVVEDGAKE